MHKVISHDTAHSARDNLLMTSHKFWLFWHPLSTISLTSFPIYVTSYVNVPWLIKLSMQMFNTNFCDFGQGHLNRNGILHKWRHTNVFFPDLLFNPSLKHLCPKNCVVVSKFICVMSFMRVLSTAGKIYFDIWASPYGICLYYPTPVIPVWGQNWISNIYFVCFN